MGKINRVITKEEREQKQQEQQKRQAEKQQRKQEIEQSIKSIDDIRNVPALRDLVYKMAVDLGYAEEDNDQ